MKVRVKARDACVTGSKPHPKHYNAQRIGFFCPDLDLSEMPTLEDLAERVERLLLRHEELKRTHALMEQQVVNLIHERDALRVRLGAARSRIDTMIVRLPEHSSAGTAAIESFESVTTDPDQPATSS